MQHRKQRLSLRCVWLVLVIGCRSSMILCTHADVQKQSTSGELRRTTPFHHGSETTRRRNNAKPLIRCITCEVREALTETTYTKTTSQVHLASSLTCGLSRSYHRRKKNECLSRGGDRKGTFFRRGTIGDIDGASPVIEKQLSSKRVRP